ncbi:HSP20-like chaperone protein [Lasiodiplodia theobromae]|uniref:HSP20-like chaperone protein n=1 Tax=Lasiodiplodia theobromae TaxID=45133 RepID=UPI0015C2CDD2|nr:HSP20-like chaperone protein [Lasiodiplodia theobromae]KAF4538403.1 HSP20-like chaperone protein [Lasiodiplodia theobromae]
MTAPDVLWAQRSCYSPDNNYVILTIAIHDVPANRLNLDLQERKVALDARSDLKNTDYHLELNLHDDIYPDETEVKHTDRQLELKLFKAEPDYWWPALLSDAEVPAYIKQDFERWVNKDAQDGEPDPLEEQIANMERQELQALADAALSSLSVSEHFVTHTERQLGAEKLTEVSSLQGDEEDSDEEDEDASDNDIGKFSDDSDSDDEDPPSPPGSGGANGRDSGGDHAHHDDSAPQDKDLDHGSGPAANDNTGKEGCRGGENNNAEGANQELPEQSSVEKWSDDDSSDVEDITVVNEQTSDRIEMQDDEDHETESGGEFRKHLAQHDRTETLDWARNLGGVRPLITRAGRKLPFNLRPLSFEAWKRLVDRTIELCNVKNSRLMQLPQDIRLDIFELAVTTGERIYFCPELRPRYEGLYANMIEEGAYKKNKTSDLRMRAAVNTAKSESCSRYYIGNDMGRCKAPALLYVSRQVSEETCIALYRRNTFAFRDIHGFVALELDVHVPIWFHGRTLDKLRSTWVFKAAKSFGLEAARPHKDRIRGSFEACINKLAKVGKLKELNLIISSENVKHWHMEYHEATAGMPSNKKIVYAKRLSQEEYMFKHVLAKVPKLVTTVVAEESIKDPRYREETWEGERAQYQRYFAAIERKCKHYGFLFERRTPQDAFRKSHRLGALRQLCNSEGLSLDNVTDEDLMNFYINYQEPQV